MEKGQDLKTCTVRRKKTNKQTLYFNINFYIHLLTGTDLETPSLNFK